MSPAKTAGTKDLQADLVIVGAGGAGMAAAVAALEKGCRSVMLLEKAGAPGGSTAMAHDIFAVESPVQRRAWFDTSRDDIFKKHMEWTHWTVDARIVRAFMEERGMSRYQLEQDEDGSIKIKSLLFFPQRLAPETLSGAEVFGRDRRPSP